MKRFLVLLFLLPTLTYAQGAGTPPYRGVNNWNLIFGTDNVFDIGATASQRPRTGYFGTSVVTPALTVSGLTSGRVPFASTGGLLADDADLTFDGTSLTGARVLFGDGTTATPSLALASDADGSGTGFFRQAANSIGVSINGTERMRINSSGQIFSENIVRMSGNGLDFAPTFGGSSDIGMNRNAAGVLKCYTGSSTRCLLGGGANVASATALPVPTGGLFHVTGTTTVTSITSTNIGTGTCFILIFDAATTVTDGSNLKLAGNFVTDGDDTLTLCSDGTSFFETSRSLN